MGQSFTKTITEASSVSGSSNDTSGDGTTNVVAYVVCGIACVALVTLIVFVYIRGKRNRMGAGGCRLFDTGRQTALPVDLTTSEHHSAAQKDALTIVLHHSHNCGYCKKFIPVAKSVANALGVRLVLSEINTSKANYMAFQELGTKGVNGVPCTTNTGNVLSVGASDEKTFKDTVQKEVLDKQK